MCVPTPLLRRITALLLRVIILLRPSCNDPITLSAPSTGAYCTDSDDRVTQMVFEYSNSFTTEISGILIFNHQERFALDYVVH